MGRACSLTITSRREKSGQEFRVKSFRPVKARLQTIADFLKAFSIYYITKNILQRLSRNNGIIRRERSTRGLGCPDDTGHRDVTSCKARDFVQFRKWRW